MTAEDVQHERASAGTTLDVLAGALTLGYNVLVNRVIPKAWYVPANLAAAGVAVALARAAGAGWDDLGLNEDRVRDGVRFGLATAVPIAGTVALAATLPATRRLFIEEGVADLPPRTLLSELLIRIPIGTALAEEVIFRGALLAAFRGRRTRRTAIVWSSALFGIWHVLPTLDTTLRRNRAAGALVGSGRIRRIETLAAIALVTGAAGAGFAALRLRSGSILAPSVVHAALNGAGLIGAVAAGRWTPASEEAFRP